MEPKDETFELVKSLSKSEKRFFRIFSSATEGRKNYLKVFDAMDRMAAYDSKKINQKLKSHKLNLSHEKNYLQRQIFKAMRNFHAESKSYMKVCAMLSEIQFLHEKEHFTLCEKIMVRAKALAEKHQHYELLIALLMWEIGVEGNLVNRTPEESYKRRIKTLDELKKTQELLQPTFDYERLNIEMVNLMRNKYRARGAEDKKALNKIMGHPLLKRNSLKGLSANPQFSFHVTHFFYHLSNGDFAKAHPHVKKTLELLEKFPEACDITPRLFYNTIHNCMYACLFSKKYDELKLLMKKYREGYYKHLPIDFSRIENLMTEDLLNYTLALALYSGDYAPGLKAINDYEKKITEYEKIVSEEQRAAMYYKMAQLLFKNEKNKEALRWLIRIINNSDSRYRPDIQCYARLLNLVVHFELHNFDYLESAIASTKRFLEKKKMLFKTEAAFLNFMKGYIKTDDKATKQKLLKEFKLALAVLKTDPFEKNAALHFDFEEWIAEKLN